MEKINQKIKLATKRAPVRPIILWLDSEIGRAIFLRVAKRVIHTHRDVLTALSRR